MSNKEKKSVIDKKLSSTLNKLEESLQKRRQQQQPTSSSSSSWERETCLGYSDKFGKYKLQILTIKGEIEEVVINEDCSMIATRVWDCAPLTSKWFEKISTTTTTRATTDSTKICNDDDDSQHEQQQQCRKNNKPNLAKALGLNIQHRPIQVLELGAGLGLLSICLAKMGAAVMATEYGVAVRYLSKSCDNNNIRIKENEQQLTAGRVLCREIDWFKTEDTLESLFTTTTQQSSPPPPPPPSSSETDGKNNTIPPKLFDLIVVTDCTLCENDACGVIKMFHKYGTKGHTKVVAGACVEREGTPSFFDGIQKVFHNIRFVPNAEYHPEYSSSRHKLIIFDI